MNSNLGLSVSRCPPGAAGGGGRALSPGAAGGTGLLGDAPRNRVTPAPGRDLSAAAGDSEEAAASGERGCGSGGGECGLKWPRRAAGVGCAMRAGQNRTGERGQRQRGGQPSASRPPENALCHRLAVVFRKVRVRGVPPLNFWVPELVPPHHLHPGGGSPFPLVPLRAAGSSRSGSCSGRNILYFV